MGKMFSQLFSSFQVMFMAWEKLMNIILYLASWGEGKANTAMKQGALEDADELAILAETIAARRTVQLAVPTIPAIAP